MGGQKGKRREEQRKGGREMEEKQKDGMKFHMETNLRPSLLGCCNSIRVTFRISRKILSAPKISLSSVQ